MKLKDEIEKLAKMQEIDSRIYALAHEKNIIIPSKINELTNQFKKSKEQLSTFEEKNKELLLRKKESELELASKEEGLKKAQGQLYQLKSNKEYQAKLTEIGSIKADISIAEDNVIDILDKTEGIKKETDIINSELKKAEGTLNTKKGELNERIKNIEIELQSLATKKSLGAKEIDPGILAKYENLIKTRRGIAIVPVKNNSCGACHMRITSQTINEIKMYLNLVLCESCVRILYIPEDSE